MTSRILNQSGNSMIVVIIGLVLLSGTCIELMTGGISQIPNLIKSYRATSTRDSLELSLMNRTSFPGIYRSSVHPDVIAGGENKDLLVCIVGLPGKLCMANMAYPLSLYSWETNAKTLTTSLVKIAGPSTSLVASATPISYDMKGNICPSVGVASGSQDSCAFLDVEATFKATCAAGAISCATAKSFQISFSLKGSSSALTTTNSSMAKKDRVASIVGINEILPPKIGAAATLTQVSSLTGSAGAAKDISGTLAIILSAGVSNTIDAAALASLLQAMGITDQNMIYAVARSSWRDQAHIQQFVDILTNNNITNVITMNALALRHSLDSVLYAGIANAISVAGITNQAIADQISNNHVTDPVLAAAYAIPKTQAMLNLIMGAAPSADSNQVNAIASALYVAGITEVSPSTVIAMAYGRISNPALITSISSAIAGSGTTNQVFINSIAVAQITNVATATQVVNTLTAVGATSQNVAGALASGNIINLPQATNFYNTMVAAGTAVTPYAYQSTGLTSSTTFNNFVTATIAAHIGYDQTHIGYLANLAIANNLTSLADMTALVSGAYTPHPTPPPTIAIAPTIAVAPTIAPAPTIVAPPTSTLPTISALNTIPGTCTVNCTASSF